MELFAEHPCVILTGETGSGKTTQVPQWCLEYSMAYNENKKDKKTVVCTQPRRMAAKSIAERVAKEMDVFLGEEVGYKYRFVDTTSPETVLKYTTDGTLLRECMTESNLEKYHVVIIDEAHERTVTSDVLMGVLKDILKRRNDLKLLIMSATIDIYKFQTYFNGAPVMKVPGRAYPVEIIYSPLPTNYLEAAVNTVLQIHRKEQIPGDILVFLTGQDEIEETCRMIEWEVEKLGTAVGEVNCIPLYSMQPPEEQQLIYEPAPPNRANGAIGRKIVVATNVAETSLTVDGVVFVVDSGQAKQRQFNPRNRVETLKKTTISKASAQQRAGRAGRTRPGKCYRLYTRAKYEAMPENATPEIMRFNLGSIVLQLKKYGFDDLGRFDFMDMPDPATIKRAEELLTNLGAVDDNGKLTTVGEIMSEFPLEPQLAKIIIAGCLEYKCADEILSIAAILSDGKSCFINAKKSKEKAKAARKVFIHEDSDHLTLLNVYNEFVKHRNQSWCRQHFLNYKTLVDVELVREQLQAIVDRLSLKRESTSKYSSDYYTNIKKALISGYFMQVANMVGYKYRTKKDYTEVYLHPSSCIEYARRPPWVIYDELVETTKNFLRTVTAVQPEWLISIAPRY